MTYLTLTLGYEFLNILASYAPITSHTNKAIIWYSHRLKLRQEDIPCCMRWARAWIAFSCSKRIGATTNKLIQMHIHKPIMRDAMQRTKRVNKLWPRKMLYWIAFCSLALYYDVVLVDIAYSSRTTTTRKHGLTDASSRRRPPVTRAHPVRLRVFKHTNKLPTQSFCSHVVRSQDVCVHKWVTRKTLRDTSIPVWCF